MRDEPNIVDRYGASYGHFDSDVYAAIRREAFGDDIGQNSWLTLDELDRFISFLNLRPSSRVLDVGCGSGGPAMQISRTSDCEVVGVDVREDALAIANRMAAEASLGSRVSFRRAHAGKPLPFEDATFDAVLCIDSVNHLPRRAGIFGDWARLLRSGGRLLFTDPTTVTGVLDSDEIAIRSSTDFYLFVPPGEDERLLAQAGLKVIRIEDATENMANVARRRHDARERHAHAVRETEGDDAFSREQRFLEVTARLARERRLSRPAYVAQKPGSSKNVPPS
jgi:SAM-dependent methyltransferase